MQQVSKIPAKILPLERGLNRSISPRNPGTGRRCRRRAAAAPRPASAAPGAAPPAAPEKRPAPPAAVPLVDSFGLSVQTIWAPLNPTKPLDMLRTQARQCMLGCKGGSRGPHVAQVAAGTQPGLPRSSGAFHAAAKAAKPCAMISRYHSTQAPRQKPGCTCSRMGQHSSARPDGARWRAIAAARPATWRRSYATSLPMMTCARRGARAGQPSQRVLWMRGRRPHGRLLQGGNRNTMQSGLGLAAAPPGSLQHPHFWQSG